MAAKGFREGTSDYGLNCIAHGHLVSRCCTLTVVSGLIVADVIFLNCETTTV